LVPHISKNEKEKEKRVSGLILFFTPNWFGRLEKEKEKEK
jgi:hypothetical protein